MTTVSLLLLLLLLFPLLCKPSGELGLHSLINQAQSRGDENAPMAAKASPMPKFGWLLLTTYNETIHFEVLYRMYNM